MEKQGKPSKCMCVLCTVRWFRIWEQSEQFHDVHKNRNRNSNDVRPLIRWRSSNHNWKHNERSWVSVHSKYNINRKKRETNRTGWDSTAKERKKEWKKGKKKKRKKNTKKNIHRIRTEPFQTRNEILRYCRSRCCWLLLCYGFIFFIVQSGGSNSVLQFASQFAVITAICDSLLFFLSFSFAFVALVLFKFSVSFQLARIPFYLSYHFHSNSLSDCVHHSLWPFLD